VPSRVVSGDALRHALGTFSICLYRETVSSEKPPALGPADARSLNRAGVALHRLGRQEEASAAFRRAIASDSRYAEPACNLATILRECGDASEATRWVLRAIEIEPGNGRYYRHLVDGSPPGDARVFLDVVESAASGLASMPADQAIELHFALARVYEDAERWDDAFRHLRAGNESYRKAINYDVNDDLGFLAALERTFSRELCAAFARCGARSERPVFIVGMPRSGTTLVEQILSANPAVYAAGELRAFEESFSGLFETRATEPAHIVTSIRGVGERYLEAIASYSGDRVVDKMPFNFRFLGLIHLALPDARIVWVRRDPLDTGFSIYATFFSDAMQFSYDLVEIGRFYRAYERLMDHWRAIVPPDRLLEVRYEDVVGDLETSARLITAFCNVPWSDESLAFHRAPRIVKTASHTQVRRPLYRSSLARAQHFAAHLGPLAAVLRAGTT
jgi:tetratricopeptide (TPR) repeat protein